MLSLGVCIGSSNISYVLTSLDNGVTRILGSDSIVHEGNPEKVITGLFNSGDFRGTTRLGVTGRKFRYFLNAPSISEPEDQDADGVQGGADYVITGQRQSACGAPTLEDYLLLSANWKSPDKA
jgi:hypothetical protein